MHNRLEIDTVRLMRCPGCGSDNRQGARYCHECGARVDLRCPGCGAALESGSKFCDACGASVAAPPPPTTPRFVGPQAYTPPHLAEKILTSRAALEGERKQVTVLFADLKGSMELLADRDPEEARKILDPVLELMMDAVHRHEGTVNQVMGDGIMALFGAPLALEDHAVRGCYAALRLRESVNHYAEQLQRAGGIPVQIRVGLNSGEVVVRSIGSDLHMDYTAVGQTTHLAARMEQMAKPGSVLVTGETLRLAEGYVQVKPLGPVPVKGLEHPIDVYEIVGAGPARSRLQATSGRGLTRFVGRQTELEALRQSLERAHAGHGQVVAVVGEPGVGKSRLFWELTHTPSSGALGGWLVVESASVSYGKAAPYFPVAELLRGYFQIEDRDDARKIREKVTGKILTLDQTLGTTLPAVLALLDLPVEDPAWQALDPRQRRHRMLEAVKRLLLRESQVQPLLVVFEDLHWIDGESQAFLDGLVESLPTARLLLLVNYRPEYEHRWGSKTYYTQLRLDPLPAESAGELLHALLGADPGLDPIKRLLIEHTEGNPFFLEESVWTLVEIKIVAGERGAYRAVKPLDAIQVPATVQAVLAARIDRLPPMEKGLLQLASVIGETIPFRLLEAVGELPAETLRGALTHLQAAEFLYETSLFPDLEYTFKHGLTYQVAYHSLLMERRRTLHARILVAIETLWADRLTEQVDRLAHHAVRGEVWDTAVTYLRQAAARAGARSAFREAAAYAEQAIEAVAHLPQTTETMAQAVDVRLDLRRALVPFARYAEIVERLREAETLATALDDRRRLGQILAFTCHALRMRQDEDAAIDAGQRALALGEELGDIDLQVDARYVLAQTHYWVGDYPRARELLSRNVETLATGDWSHATRAFFQPVTSRAWLAMTFASLGDFDEGIRHGDEAMEIAESDGRPFGRVIAQSSLGSLYLARGDVDRALALLERSLALHRTWGLLDWRATTTGFLGYAYALSGRAADGIPLIQDALEADRASIGQPASYRVRLLGEVHLMEGTIGRALECARQALELARAQQARGNEAWVVRLLGDIAARGAPPDVPAAEAHYREALALAERLGMRPLVALCHLSLGQMSRRTSQPVQAREHLSAAVALLTDMKMRFWLAEAEAEAASL